MAKSILVVNVLPFTDLKITSMILDDKISPQDGLCNVYVLNPKTFWSFFFRRKWPKFTVYRGKKIFIKQKKERKVQIDGDVFKLRQFDVKVLPRAIKVVFGRVKYN